MFEIHREEIEWGGRTLSFETGRIARQADGSVLVKYGETTVLATVVAEREARPGIDFFPLSINYMEKTYAAGKIPGGYLKREGRMSDAETLTSRLIDRPLRPLFVKGFVNETQVILTVLSHDMENAPDMVAMVAASAAITISGLPFQGPVGGARVAYINDEYVVNPTIDQMAEADLDLVVAGTKDAVLMVESEAKELSEDVMLQAVMHGHKAFQPVIEAIIRLAEKSAKAPWDIEVDDGAAQYKDMVQKIGEDDLRAAYSTADKVERQNKVSAVRDKVTAEIELSGENEVIEAGYVASAFKSLEKKIVRGDIIKTGKRIDGRDLSTVRPIVSEVGVLARTHGSALFTRGETQALVVATLGTGDDEQIIDALEGKYRENFLLHYNFPPYSVGETGRVGFTGRREIGHGKLAWRALHPVLPGKESFPYTLRVVSEITESNGSSSMATVCGTSLAMMDAGVPLERPVAGIAMGLIKDDEGVAVLSDILGDEDHLGDMDFKVAGTDRGITALQMDIKILGITEDIMKTALAQAKEGRIHILGEMSKAIGSAREEMGEYTPKIEMMTVPVDKIREVIGQGGSMIRSIVEETGCKIDINDEGQVKLAAASSESIKAAMDKIKGLTMEPEVGAVYEGTIVKTVDFGAFVNFFGPKDGLVHISQLADHRVEKVTDIVKEGQKIYVQLMGFDDRGKVRLSMKTVDQETGKVLEDG